MKLFEDMTREEIEQLTSEEYNEVYGDWCDRMAAIEDAKAEAEYI